MEHPHTGRRRPIVFDRELARERDDVVHARLLVLGGDRARIQEELILAGGSVVKGKFNRIRTQKELVELESGALSRGVSERREEDIRKLWPQIRAGLESALAVRTKERTKNLQAELVRRRDREVGDIAEILSELAERIRNELREEPQLRLEFNAAEQEQYKRDREHLQRRQERIPAEIEKETERIRARYADPDPRMFPVAVTILVPEQLDH